MTKYRTSGPDGPRPATTATERAACRGVDGGGVNPQISNDELMRFVDGALDDDGRVRVLTHLASRPESVGRVEAYLHQNASLRLLREHLPLGDSATFEAPLQAAIVESLIRRQRRRTWRRLAVAATVLVALAGGVAGLSLQHWQEPTQTAAPAPVQAYFLFAQHDVGIAMDPDAALAQAPEIEPTAFAWLADRAANVTISAPDLHSVGLELIDGEVLDRQGAPAIRAVYRNAVGKPVVLFAGIGKPDVQHAFWLEREGYVSLQWRRGPMIFALVAPTDSPQLSTIVDLVGAAVAAIVLPEDETTGTGAGGEPTLAQPTPAEAAPAETGPLQSIALPAAPVVDPSGDPATVAEPDAVNADPLSETADSNAPEAL